MSKRLKWIMIVVLMLVDAVVLTLVLINKQENPNAPRLIVMSFDGFRYDYLDPDLTPNLFELAKQGVTGYMLATFATKTFPNHHSIATGLYQETHGIVHNIMFDPEFGVMFADKEDGMEDRWWDNRISTPLYIANQLFDRRRASCCSPWIGCHVRYFGKHRVRYHRFYNKSDNWYEQFEWSLEHMFRTDSPANLAMIYMQEPDFTAHKNGPFGVATIEEVRKIDKFLGYVRDRMRQLQLDKDTNLILVSDHGVSEVHPRRVSVLSHFLNTSWYSAYGGNPLIHIQPRPGYELQVEKALRAKEAGGNVRLFLKRSMPARLHYRHHRRILDLVLVAKDGWSLHLDQEAANNQRNDLGQHGYDNLEASMRPLFVGVGPAFKRGYRSPTRFTNVDLYPLMLRLLGIPPDAFYHEGNLTKVASLLRNEPSSSSSGGSRGQGASLT